MEELLTNKGVWRYETEKGSGGNGSQEGEVERIKEVEKP